MCEGYEGDDDDLEHDVYYLGRTVYPDPTQTRIDASSVVVFVLTLALGTEDRRCGE